MQRLQLNKIIACNFAIMGILYGLGLNWAHASVLQNTQVGPANGPEGPTNVQTIADFENHPLYTATNQSSDGHHWAGRLEGQSITLSIDNCGPPHSTKCLAVSQIPGFVGSRGTDYNQYFWYTGPRLGTNVYIKEALRANTFHSW